MFHDAGRGLVIRKSVLKFSNVRDFLDVFLLLIYVNVIVIREHTGHSLNPVSVRFGLCSRLRAVLVGDLQARFRAPFRAVRLLCRPSDWALPPLRQLCRFETSGVAALTILALSK